MKYLLLLLILTNCSTINIKSKQNVPVVNSEQSKNVSENILIYYFDFDSHKVKFPDKLKQNLKTLKVAKEKQLVIEGHCDIRGSSEYNTKLGLNRALTIKSYIEDKSITVDLISLGKTFATKCKTKKCFQRDRKAVVSIVDKN